MYTNPSSSERVYTVEEAAPILGRTVNSVEQLIRQGLLGFEVSQFGVVITSAQIANFYLGVKPLRKPEYKPEKPRRKMPKRYVKARTKR